jgi:PmbA protein
LESILSKALERVDEAEVYYEENEHTPVVFKADRLHSISTKHVRGVGLRVIKDGKIGFSSTSDLSKVDELIDAAVESSRFGQEARFEFPGSSDFPEVRIFDDRVVDFSIEDAVREGSSVVAMVKEKEPDLKVDAHIEKITARTGIINSRGLDFSFDKTYFTYVVEAFLLTDGSFVWVFEGESKCSLCLETERFAKDILWKAALAKKVVKVPDRSMPVLFMPDAIVSLLAAFAMGVNGKHVQKGSSPLVNRVGERVVGKEVTICDDGLLDCGLGSSPVDGEGTPCGKLPLIEEGVLNRYVFDLQTAGLMGFGTTGNAGRGYNSMPAPRVSNFCVAPGKASDKDMLKTLNEGIVVYDVLGSGQSNLLAGDFSVSVSLGFKVEKGEMVGRVKDTMIAGNVYDIFNKVAQVGSEVKEVWGYCSPSFCFSDVRVASKGE